MLNEPVHLVGAVQFNVTPKLIKKVAGSLAKNLGGLQEKQKLAKQEVQKKKEATPDACAKQKQRTKLDEIKLEIGKCELSLKAAIKIVEDSNFKLQKELSPKSKIQGRKKYVLSSKLGLGWAEKKL